MATYKYCDHMDHEEGAGGQFTPATCFVQAWWHGEKNTSLLESKASKDTCDEHLGEIVENMMSSNRREKRFDYIKIIALPGAKK